MEQTVATESIRDRQLNQQGNLAFVLVVVISYVILFITPVQQYSLPHVALLIGLGVVYVVLGTAGLHFILERHSFPALLVYYLIQLGLALILILASGSQGQLWLLPLPLVSQAAMTLPRRWLLLVCTLTLAVLLAPMLLSGDLPNIVQAGVAFAAGIFFVVLFSQIATNEHNAHAEGERLAAELSEANRKLRAYAVQAEDLATMQERNRLARDIHDGLGHYLTVINVQLQVAQTMLDSDAAASRAALDKAQSLTQQALADVRRSVAALRSTPTEGRALSEAISDLVEENRAAGIVTELVVHGAPRPLSPQADLTLYRAVQEALTNVRKHARASRVDLALDYSHEGTALLVIRDNGIGTDETETGFGLLGLRERVHLLGGTVTIHTAPREGFTLTVEVPV